MGGAGELEIAEGTKGSYDWLAAGKASAEEGGLFPSINWKNLTNLNMNDFC